MKGNNEMYFDYSLAQLTEVYKTAQQNEMPPRWRSALDRAFGILKGIDSVKVTFAGDGSISEATIPSQSGNKEYRVTNSCTCEAAQHGKPCAHVAAARLVTRMVEAQGAQIVASVMDEAEYQQRRVYLELKLDYFQRKLESLDSEWKSQQERMVEMPVGETAREKAQREILELFPS
jgi:hypothetical protein